MTRFLASMVAGLSARIVDALRREDGTATMEFVLVIPIFMMIFMASFESGLLMTRSIMLEQSVDMTMRELRLGHYTQVTNNLLKNEICSRTIIFADCKNSMKIELDRVSTTTWNVPVEPAHCINRHEDAEPVVSMGSLADNDLMMVRVCVVLQAMFPTTGIAMDMPLDSDGGYGLIARSAFVTEPS
ncbi:MAG: TadE family protein [bacterium]